jgi:hypothetical protein
MSITTYFEKGNLVSVDFQDGTPAFPAVIVASRFEYHHGLGDEVTLFQLEDLTDGTSVQLTLDEVNRFATVID